MGKLAVFGMAASLLLSGCSSLLEAGAPKPDDPDFAPAMPEERTATEIGRAHV